MSQFDYNAINPEVDSIHNPPMAEPRRVREWSDRYQTYTGQNPDPELPQFSDQDHALMEYQSQRKIVWEERKHDEDDRCIEYRLYDIDKFGFSHWTGWRVTPNAKDACLLMFFARHADHPDFHSAGFFQLADAMVAAEIEFRKQQRRDWYARNGGAP